jgi:hypothetical protein
MCKRRKSVTVTRSVTVTTIHRIDIKLNRYGLFLCDAFLSHTQWVLIAHDSYFVKRQRSARPCIDTGVKMRGVFVHALKRPRGRAIAAIA